MSQNPIEASSLNMAKESQVKDLHIKQDSGIDLAGITAELKEGLQEEIEKTKNSIEPKTSEADIESQEQKPASQAKKPVIQASAQAAAAPAPGPTDPLSAKPKHITEQYEDALNKATDIAENSKDGTMSISDATMAAVEIDVCGKLMNFWQASEKKRADAIKKSTEGLNQKSTPAA